MGPMNIQELFSGGALTKKGEDVVRRVLKGEQMTMDSLAEAMAQLLFNEGMTASRVHGISEFM